MKTVTIRTVDNKSYISVIPENKTTKDVCLWIKGAVRDNGLCRIDPPKKNDKAGIDYIVARHIVSFNINE